MIWPSGRASEAARARCEHRGWVFTPRQFAHLGTRAAVDQALSRLQRSGQIRRLSRGGLRIPEDTSPDRVLSPSPEAVAKAMAERTGSRITITGAQAANLLGLSTQVPMQSVFWTEGPFRTVRIGNQTVMLKHVAPSKMIGAGTEAGIVIQAIRSLGKKGVHEIPVHALRKQLPRRVKRAVKRLTPAAPVWSQPVLNQNSAQTRGGLRNRRNYFEESAARRDSTTTAVERTFGSAGP